MSGSIVVQRIVSTIGALGLLATLPFYLASGLVAPLWAIVVLWLVWLGLGLLAFQWFTRRPWAVLLLPVVAIGIWWLAITLGEQVLGWTA